MFNVIFMFILMKENDIVEVMVLRLSDFLCYLLDNDFIKKVFLGQEIKVLCLYLEIEKVWFGECLEVIWDIEDDCEDVMVFSMIL